MHIPPFKLERYLSRYEFDVPYFLCGSDCESLSVGDLLALEPGAEEAFRNLRLGYTECPGDRRLRSAIAGQYAGMDPDEILVFAGAEEGIFIFMNTVLGPGDHIIVQYPAYQSLHEIARAIGCQVTYWRMNEDSAWSLDLDDLVRALRPTTRAIVINTPNNPTGSLMERDLFDGMIDIARDHGLYIFSDEVYRYLEHDPRARLPAIADVYEKGVSLGVMSKAYGLPGLRIGWIAAKDADLLQNMLQLKDYTSICSSAPSEFLSLIALHHHDELVARTMAIIEGNLSLVDGMFARWSEVFAWARPVAGSIGFPRLLADQHIEEFCDDLVGRCGVILLPGTAFDDDARHFRIGFGRLNMGDCLVRLEQYLEERFS
ncbi:MAG: aminotransferase class I/II-fold pyridoxal phosphate-dependent enzyme [Methanomicrobiaceae archaeon]|nr:aminotransferase class I/II-fold pyridoxal phosphate-dependent enzyme [Methanomicrobiaceae archaeon]